MSLPRITSPHAHAALDTGQVMKLVLLALVPGVLTQIYFFGLGTLVQILLACGTAIACEAGILKLRNRPIAFYLKDNSALVTAVLLAIALPAYAPWWITIIGVSFAIIIGKQLYGGLGYNPFNPAMLGYVVLLISFPVQMTAWAIPVETLPEQQSVPGLLTALSFIFGFGSAAVDGYTMATPLDLMKQNSELMVQDLWLSNPQFGTLAGRGWESINFWFMIGGLFLLYKRIYTWHAPASMLIVLAVWSAIFYDSGSSTSGGSPIFHWFSGATMLGAFFILTDPVSSAVSNRGRLIYGALVGSLLFLIRSWGNYPDAMAFAILLANFAAPFIDHYTQPRTYGHKPEGS